MKKYICIIAVFAAALGLVSCDDDILENVESYVTLNAENTYLAGDEVTFDVKGIADYIYYYTGEVGSQYIYKDRTTISMEDLETCTLVITYQARYGTAGALDVYASKTFAGLSGNNASADLATMQAIESSMDASKNIEGWEKLTYSEGASNVTTSQEYDITGYADSFCLAFHWNVATHTATQRTYWINIYLKTKFKGYDEVTMRGTDLGMISVSMNYPDDPYYKNNGNGTVRFNDGANDINMQGVGANVLAFALNSWVLTTPRPLNSITPDKGTAIKSMAEDLEQYSYVYQQPGTYTASFVMTNGNYQGLNRKVQDLTFTIIDPIEVP